MQIAKAKLSFCKLNGKLTAPFIERGTYKNWKQALLVLIGYSVGLGNFWRLPYLTYKYGGVTFLIPYCLAMFCIGIPLYFMELALGTYVGVAPTRLFTFMCPALSGVGYGMVFILFAIVIYYNVIIAWTLFYISASLTFSNPLPWARCDYEHMSANCSTDTVEGLFVAAKYYYDYRVMGLPQEAQEDEGSDYDVNAKMVASLGVAWLLVTLCLARGIRGTSKVLYFTVFYPYALMGLILAWSLDNTSEADESVRKESFFSVQTSLLKDPAVWNTAATQVIYSLGVAYGGIIGLSSYNKLGHNILRDAFLVSLLEGLTAFMSAYIVYNVSGVLTDMLLEESGSTSPLVFITFPAVLSRMGRLGLWSLLFFIMIFTMGFDSQLLMVETVTTALFDEFHILRRKFIPVMAGACFVMFLLGVPMATRSGKEIFDMLDANTNSHSLLLLGLLEVIIVNYIYGFNKMMEKIKNDLRIWVPKPFLLYWAITWNFLTPVSLLALLCSSLYLQDWSGIQHSHPLSIIGILISFSVFIIVPIRTVCVICLSFRKEGFTWKTFKQLWHATPDFCPEYIRNGRGPQVQDNNITVNSVERICIPDPFGSYPFG